MLQKNKKLLIVRLGFVNNEDRAVRVYLIVSIVLIVVSIAILAMSDRSQVLPYEKISESAKAQLPADARRIIEQQHANTIK